MQSRRLIVGRAAAALVLAGGLHLGARRLGPLPALGRFLDPASGVWAVARAARLPALDRRSIPGLTAAVDVRYDDRGVPHIFAATREDAQRALGFVVARDRLFQLEMQTRATAGRLTELLGPVVLALDREQRRLGLAASAQEHLAAIPRDSPGWRSLAAYADGVNAWIDRLAPADLPVEYHLLSARPLRWEPVHSLYLLRRMGWTLAYSAGEFRQEAVSRLVGAAAADALFPVNSPIVEPIEPGPGRYPRHDWKRIPPPAGRADGSTGRPAAPTQSRADPSPRLPVDNADALGSNNWAGPVTERDPPRPARRRPAPGAHPPQRLVRGAPGVRRRIRRSVHPSVRRRLRSHHPGHPRHRRRLQSRRRLVVHRHGSRRGRLLRGAG